MLEPIVAYCNQKEINWKEHERLIVFLLFYKSEHGVIVMDKEKLLRMLRYFKIWNSYDTNSIENYGLFFKKNIEKLREFENNRQRSYGNPEMRFNNYIERPEYLIATYNRLKRIVSAHSQFIVLKDALLCINPDDVEIFINMLLRQYKIQQIDSIIEKIKQNKN